MFTVILSLFGASQVYWAWKGYRLLARHVRSVWIRVAICAVVVALFAVLYDLNIGSGRERASAVYLTTSEALRTAPFLWWAAGSFFGFLLAAILAVPRVLVAAGRRLLPKRPDLPSPDRRDFLATTTSVVAGAPFVAGAYGLLYGRLNLETTAPTIRLPRLPHAFQGFRICQLSDIHIGPYMPATEIRKYVQIANAVKADLIVLTGDFVTFDPDTQKPVVEALSGLRAPYGVWGCLGNHDMWTRVEDSITGLFRGIGYRMLRGEAVPITAGADSLNLIGVDFQSPRRFGPTPATGHLLGNIEHLIDRDRVNILLSHNPDTFDRAAELNIEFSLAGHTHGGQLALEFISPEIAPSRIVTPYVAGHFQKPGGQLYVNRGIGTIFLPMRVGAPPEITVYTLSRG
jgi:predicted MPP superfamily phosphohydrolase